MTRPNIIFILCDDHASQAISCYGHGINRTPNIDRIANEGARHEHCYVTNSICTPSRATILTGTHNHVNRVTTLYTHLDNRFPNVAKHFKTGGYQTAIFGKWHLGQGPMHEPSGFDAWSVLPDQGEYHDPEFIESDGRKRVEGYVTDIITDKCLNWLAKRDPERPFLLMCHHKAPHREWDPKPEHRSLYLDPIPQPKNFHDDYSNRAIAAREARMRVVRDMTYADLDLIQLPEAPGPRRLGHHKYIPHPEDTEGFTLRCALTGKEYAFQSQNELADFKYQRYLRKYLQCVHSIDENTGRILDYLDENGLTENTLVIYSSDQGFYLGEHGWFDKRLMYEESFRMPFLARWPAEIPAGTVCNDMASNVDFAQTFLDAAGLTQPNYMQGRSLLPMLRCKTPDDWRQVAYYRYWMNQDDIHNVVAHYGIRTHDYKLIYWHNDGCGEHGGNPGTHAPEWELFDLRKDPSEMCNVVADPNYAEEFRKMRVLLDEEMLRIGDTPLHPPAQ